MESDVVIVGGGIAGSTLYGSSGHTAQPDDNAFSLD